MIVYIFNFIYIYKYRFWCFFLSAKVMAILSIWHNLCLSALVFTPICWILQAYICLVFLSLESQILTQELVTSWMKPETSNGSKPKLLTLFLNCIILVWLSNKFSSLALTIQNPSPPGKSRKPYLPRIYHNPSLWTIFSQWKPISLSEPWDYLRFTLNLILACSETTNRVLFPADVSSQQDFQNPKPQQYSKYIQHQKHLTALTVAQHLNQLKPPYKSIS